jgi:hypothetical protein
MLPNEERANDGISFINCRDSKSDEMCKRAPTTTQSMD